MKKYLLAVFVLFVFVGGARGENLFKIPNLEATTVYSLKAFEFSPAVTSKFISYRMVEGRVGYLLNNNHVFVGSLAVNMRSLPATVEYAWESIADVTVGLYLGFDSKNKEIDYGISGGL